MSFHHLVLLVDVVKVCAGLTPFTYNSGSVPFCVITICAQVLSEKAAASVCKIH